MESASSTVMSSSSATKSVKFESSTMEAGGESKVFKLTRSTSSDGRPVFTKTIEGLNLERKWAKLKS